MLVGKKILVVGDDARLLRFLGDGLGERGCRVSSFRNRDGELSTVLQEELPDLVLLDVMMPGLDGLGVGLRIRQCSEVPIIMVSTCGAGPDRVRGLDLGAEGFLTEPFDAGELVSRIEKAFGGDELLRDNTSKSPVYLAM
ncbi:MAG: response regulator [Dehalococcoidia bacterium]